MNHDFILLYHFNFVLVLVEVEKSPDKMKSNMFFNLLQKENGAFYA